MKRISLILALCAAVPLVSTACSKDDSSGGGDGDGDGDGTGGVVVGDGDGDGTGGMVGDGDGDTGGMPGDGDGDTGGTAMGGDGMGGDPSMGGMGGTIGDDDLATACPPRCQARTDANCSNMNDQDACVSECLDMPNLYPECADEWMAQVSCEKDLSESDYMCVFDFVAPANGACATERAAYQLCSE